MAKLNIQVSSEEFLKLDREEILKKYTPFVKSIAQKIAMRVPYNILLDDLISCGMLGLMDAISKYSAEKKNNFGTYARFRIRGAMLDELRSQDWASRSVRKKSKLFEEAVNSLRSSEGKEPSLSSVAKHLKMSQKEFSRLLREVAPVNLSSLSEKEENYSDSMEGLMKSLYDSDHVKPDTLLMQKNLQQTVMSCIKSLPERERIVISMYYYNDYSLRDIGQYLKLTESRVSQLHIRAISLLKESVFNKTGMVKKKKFDSLKKQAA